MRKLIGRVSSYAGTSWSGCIGLYFVLVFRQAQYITILFATLKGNATSWSMSIIKLFPSRPLRFFISLASFLLLLLLNSCKSPSIETPEPYTLEYPNYFGKPKLPQDNPLTKEGVDLGKKLFFSPLLSSTNQISCANCHKPQFSFADNQNFSEGVLGNKVDLNVPHLINLAWNPGPFGWEGKSPSIRKAIENALTSPLEMDINLNEIIPKLEKKQDLKLSFKKAFPYSTQPITKENLLKALEQYTLTLVSFNSRYDLWRQGKLQPTESEKRGFELFFKSPKPNEQRGAGCGDCHTGHITTNGLFMNNGLYPIENGLSNFTQNPFDKGKFKVPSLRNVELTSPYMHNAKFKTLDEVIEHYNSGVHVNEFTSPILLYQQNERGSSPNLNLTLQEKQDLAVFLRMLTDTLVLKK